MKFEDRFNVLAFLGAALWFVFMGWEIITALAGNSPMLFTELEENSSSSLIGLVNLLGLGVSLCLIGIVGSTRTDRVLRDVVKGTVGANLCTGYGSNPTWFLSGGILAANGRLVPSERTLKYFSWTRPLTGTDD